MSAQPDSASRQRRMPAGYELRQLRETDAAELHALIEDNRARLARWIQWAREQTLQDTRQFIRRSRAMEQDGSGLSRGIIAVGRLAGIVGITIDRSNRSGAIGYWLDERSEGKGVVTAAVAALAGDGFDLHRLVRVEIRADIENATSRAVAERLGFKLEGVLRQSYRVNDEHYSDDAVYSLLASEAQALG